MPRHNSTPEMSFASVGQNLNSVFNAANIADSATEALGMDKNTAKTVKNVVIAGTVLFLLYQALKTKK